ncbi:MAG: glycosyltransferase [Thermoleophilaceae bacterium]|nr:glycosyltransferase [Thermoleophilaceae bacterium]
MSATPEDTATASPAWAPVPAGKRLFVSWIPLFRATALAKGIGAELYVPSPGGGSWPAPLRYLVQTARTAARVARVRPRDVMFTNPPFICGAVLVVLARLTGMRVWSDTHSGAFNDPKWRRLSALSGWVLRRCRGVIVHTPVLVGEVEAMGGRPIVVTNPAAEPLERSVVDQPKLVATLGYNFDEPVSELIEAARMLPDVQIVMTGNAPEWVRQSVPANCTVTGFISRAEYDAHLASARAVVCLTTREDTMQRGAHEAMQYGLPMMLSGTRVLREYFRSGIVWVDRSDAETLAIGLRRVWDEYEELGAASLAERDETLASARVQVRELNAMMAAGG